MYRKIEVRLTSWQRQRLQQLRDRPPTPRVGKRAVCLLLSAEGVSNQLIVQATGLAPDTLVKIPRRWSEWGMAVLHNFDRPSPGLFFSETDQKLGGLQGIGAERTQHLDGGGR